jgi:hypothetical protein
MLFQQFLMKEWSQPDLVTFNIKFVLWLRKWFRNGLSGTGSGFIEMVLKRQWELQVVNGLNENRFSVIF